MKPTCPKCLEVIKAGATRCPHCQASIDPNDYMPAFEEARQKRSDQIDRAKKWTVRAVSVIVLLPVSVIVLLIATLATVAAWDAHRIMEANYRLEMKIWDCDRKQAVESREYEDQVLASDYIHRDPPEDFTPQNFERLFWLIATFKLPPIKHANWVEIFIEDLIQSYDLEETGWENRLEFTKWARLDEAFEQMHEAAQRGEIFPSPPSFYRTGKTVPEFAWRRKFASDEQIRPYLPEDFRVVPGSDN